MVKEPGDIASQYISYLDTQEIDIADAQEDEILIKRDGKLHRLSVYLLAYISSVLTLKLTVLYLTVCLAYKMVLTFFGSKLRLQT